MAFTELSGVHNSPGRICRTPFSSILRAFPAKELETHDGAGYCFQSLPCGFATSYSPDFCQPGDIKMSPISYGAEDCAILGVIQSAIRCPLGVTDEELRDEARSIVERNLWRAVDADLLVKLAAEATVFAGSSSPVQALANAAQFLAANSQCGTGVIMGSAAWFTQLGFHHVVKDGDIYRDLFDNIVIVSASSINQVYAFDGIVDVRASEILLLDEQMPGRRVNNDRVVRAEQVYSIGLDNCSVGQFTYEPCSCC